MNKTIILLILLIAGIVVLTGCTKYIGVQVNNTIHTNETHYYYNTTIEYVNVTQDCVQECNVSNADPTYVLGLIQQIKRCESNLIRNWNLTECVWEIERLNSSLSICNESLEDIRDLVG